MRFDNKLTAYTYTMQLCRWKGKSRKYYVFFVINNRALIDIKRLNGNA